MGGGRALGENPAEGGNRAERTLPFRTVPTRRFEILFRNEDTFDGSRELTTLYGIFGSDSGNQGCASLI